MMYNVYSKPFGRSDRCQKEDDGMSNKFRPESQAIVSYSLMGPESGGPCLVDSNDNLSLIHI